MFQLAKTHPRYPKYKPTNIDWIGDIPEGWEVKKLKYVAKLIMGQSPDGDSVNDEGIGMPFFQGKSEFGDLFPSVKKWCSSPTKIARENDILISVRAPVGDLNIANSECCIGRWLAAVRNDEYKFLYYGLFSQHSQLNSFNTGSTFEAIGSDILANTNIAAPSLEEQQEITVYLDEKTALLDEAIAKKQRQIELLSEHRTALINSAITKGLDPNAEMKDSGIEWIGMIPKGWEVRKMKYMASIFNGADHKEIEDESGEFPVYGSGWEFARAKVSVYEWPSVLLGRKGTIDKPLFIESPFWTVDTMFYTKIFDCIEPKLFYYLCLNINFKKYQNGSALPSMTQSILSNIEFPISTDMDEQKRIVKYLEGEITHIDAMKEKIQRSIDLLQEYKTSLISQVVSGKIKVS